MGILSHRIKSIRAGIMIVTALLFSGSVLAVGIAQAPLFVGNKVPPAIMFILDDSGSMDWEVLTVKHFPAKNYDNDYTRAWARTGSFRTASFANTPITTGGWEGFSGTCQDRNADGLCPNGLDLNGNGVTHDSEQTKAAAGQTLYRLGLRHLYYRVITNGTCVIDPIGDATDYLPALDSVLAWLTGSDIALAHEYTGPAPLPSIPSTDPAYAEETWSWYGNYSTQYNIKSAAYLQAETNCLNKPGNWKFEADPSSIIYVHGGERAADHLIRQNSSVFPALPAWHNNTPWTGPAATIDPTTGAISGGTFPRDNNRLGGYHEEYKIFDPTISLNGFDISGNNSYDPDYREDDLMGGSVPYTYLYSNLDNAYNGSCTGSNNFGRPAFGCDHLIYTDYPTGYPYDVTNPAVAATSHSLPGNQGILSLKEKVKRAMKATWPSPPSVTEINFGGMTWASWSDSSRGISNRTSAYGTRHAVSKYDSWPTIADWRIRSSSFNVLYYNPAVEYKHWPSTNLSNATITAVHSYPLPGTAGYNAPTKNLLRPQPNGDEAGFVYEVWNDDAGFWGAVPKYYNSSGSCSSSGFLINGGDPAVGVKDPATGNIVQAGDHVCANYIDQPNKMVDLWDTHKRVTVYSTNIKVQTIRRTPHIFGESVDPSTNSTKKFISDTRILSETTYNAGTAYAVGSGCEEVLGEDSNNPGYCRTVAEVHQNVANWYQYSRRRSFVAKGIIASLIDEQQGVNFGLMSTSRDLSATDDYLQALSSNDISRLFRDVYDGTGSGNSHDIRNTHNTNLKEALYSLTSDQYGTPLRLALKRAGEYFAGNGPNLSGGGATDPDNHSTSPITLSCQKSYAFLVTDGYWDSGVNPSGINDEDNDTVTPTLADIAKKYYDMDLRPNLDPSTRQTTDRGNNLSDFKEQQHLITVGIGFGVEGNLVDDNDNGWPGNVAGSALTENDNWGDPTVTNAEPDKLDDLWHAAYNSRGLFKKADNPVALKNALIEAINEALKTQGSGSALTANSRQLTQSTKVYQTLFGTEKWSGDVRAFSIQPNTGLFDQTVVWSAQTKLDSAAVTSGSRKIFTLSAEASPNGIPFKWNQLSAIQKTQLRKKLPTGVGDIAYGKKILAFLRGDRAEEGVLFRKRNSRLGDIVHSEALYVKESEQRYPDDWYPAQPYSNFKNTNSTRTGMLYVGSNDGMLHAFDATTGEEKYAYIPKSLIPDLNHYATQPSGGLAYQHRYYVDETPAINDVFFGSNWHTVLVGGLRAGGKAIYALDVTTVPTAASGETTIATNKAMWEFTSSDDADLGYTFGRPKIVRLNNGQWGAIFSNGYNSDNEKAVLFIVNIEDRSIIKKFDTQVGNNALSNGLSSPTVVDIDGDMIADRVYAGDLLGNVWSIDITGSDKAMWDFSYKKSSGEPAPLFTAINDAGDAQAITSEITVMEHPLGSAAGFLLNFGTGKYLSNGDNTVAGYPQQSIYGVWDSGKGGVSRADLLEQEVLQDQGGSGVTTGTRITTNNTLDWFTSSVAIGDQNWRDQINKFGWYLDLPDNTGERMANNPTQRGGVLTFTTLLPQAGGCSGGGGGYLMALNAATGSRFTTPPFDITGDGVFNVDDLVNYTDSNGVTSKTAISGVKVTDGLPSTPLQLEVGGSGNLQTVTNNSSATTSVNNNSNNNTTANVVGLTCIPGPGADQSTACQLDGTTNTCTKTAGPGVCLKKSNCPGTCQQFGFTDVGRQSWIQLE